MNQWYIKYSILKLKQILLPLTFFQFTGTKHGGLCRKKKVLKKVQVHDVLQRFFLRGTHFFKDFFSTQAPVIESTISIVRYLSNGHHVFFTMNSRKFAEEVQHCLVWLVPHFLVIVQVLHVIYLSRNQSSCSIIYFCFRIRFRETSDRK